MKYFALLTKLGENLLAQATALGTKLELTHMAVGDGGGSLPTPDTNQTKLIKEQRRAAINTLFIDEQNKNQIIAEQIIPEKDGGWWIREIGLFDKAGNLIAVANCPETYKPQLEEGSGRTQSIRMVLIVSHTESVTLKIDPSVVLATREYVNTEITIIDKKIDALSAQTKLDLNKKFDKENISDVKGNDTAKVPSLHLFTGVIGKLQPKGDYAPTGYSYSKTESDGRYQPKAEYATSQALSDGLSKKFDKTGGDITGQVNVSSAVIASQIAAKTINNSAVQLNPIDSGPRIEHRKNGGTWFTHTLPDATGTLLQQGDFGLGSGYGKPIPDADYDNIALSGFYGGTGANGANLPPGQIRYGGAIAAFRYANEGFIITAHRDDIAVRVKTAETGWGDFFRFYTEKNTQTDHNGNVKIKGYLERQDYLVGAPIPWPQSTAPAGYLVCNGQSFNKTTYPLLAKAYPTGVLPDLRGEFIRGVDYGRGVDANRVVLSAQGDAIRNITGEFANNGNTMSDDSYSAGVGAFAKKRSSNVRSNREVDFVGCTYSFDASRVVPTANENRSRNIAFLYIVRAA